MAVNSDPQVIRFSNERVRPVADEFAKLRRMALALLEDYNAQNVGAAINTAGPANLIVDGSETDGRPRMTGGQIYNFITLCDAFAVTAPFMDAGRVSVVNGIQVNGNR